MSRLHSLGHQQLRTPKQEGAEAHMEQLFAVISSGPAITFPTISYKAIGPEIVLVVGALVVMLTTSLFPSTRRTRTPSILAALAALIAFADSATMWANFADHGPYRAIASSLTIDGFAVFMLTTISATTFLGTLLGSAYLSEGRFGTGEFQGLLLLSATGAMLLASAGDLIVIFLGLEILSIALYVLAGFEKRSGASGEAALKYFILGGFSSALFLYGIALTYGATGSTNIAKIAGFLASNSITSNGVLLAGMSLLIVGLGFKVAAVPFHLWTPDVYQGSPSASVGYMAAVAKAAGFAGLLRILVSALPTLRLDWQPIIWALAALTLLVGAVLAVVQNDLKRMLAYSSINHAGFVLLGVEAATSKGTSASIYYLLAYAFMVVATFAIVNSFEDRETGRVPLENLRGLASRNPGIAFFLAVLLVAQAGAPLTTGLVAKFAVVSAVVAAHSYVLAVIAMLSAVIATFFYLRVVAVAYARGPRRRSLVRQPQMAMAATTGVAGEGETEVASAPLAEKVSLPVEAQIVVGIGVAGTVIFGIFPNYILHMAEIAKVLL